MRFLFPFLFATPAFAEVEMLFSKAMETPYGAITIAKTAEGEQALIGPYPIPGAADFYVFSQGLHALSDGSHIAILTVHSGGNACGGFFVLVTMSAEAIVPTESFGNCADILLDVRVEGTRFEMDIPATDPGFDKVTYRLEGGVLEEFRYPREMAEIAAGPGADVTRWIGEHPERILKEPTERKRFSGIMSVEEMNNLSMSVRVASNAEQRGNHVVGWGCAPHMCGIQTGAWAIDIATGAPAAAIQIDGQFRIFGTEDPGLRALLQTLLNGG